MWPARYMWHAAPPKMGLQLHQSPKLPADEDQHLILLLESPSPLITVFAPQGRLTPRRSVAVESNRGCMLHAPQTRSRHLCILVGPIILCPAACSCGQAKKRVKRRSWVASATDGGCSLSQGASTHSRCADCVQPNAHASLPDSHSQCDKAGRQ